jgi:hypothetical protein
MRPMRRIERKCAEIFFNSTTSSQSAKKSLDTNAWCFLDADIGQNRGDKRDAGLKDDAVGDDGDCSATQVSFDAREVGCCCHFA